MEKKTVLGLLHLRATPRRANVVTWGYDWETSSGKRDWLATMLLMVLLVATAITVRANLSAPCLLTASKPLVAVVMVRFLCYSLSRLLATDTPAMTLLSRVAMKAVEVVAVVVRRGMAVVVVGAETPGGCWTSDLLYIATLCFTLLATR